MEEIAAAADYSRRSLYRYFKSRDEICLMILVEDLRRRWERQRAALAAAGTGLAKIVAWGESLFAFSRENPQSLQLQIYWDYRGIDPERISRDVFREFEAINIELADGLRDLFGQGVADGSLRADLQIDRCISQYLYSLRSVINRALSSGYSFRTFDPEDYVRHYLDLFARAIRSAEEANHAR